jgi:hypothetical protein
LEALVYHERPGRYTVDQNRRLRVLGQPQYVLGAFETEALQVIAKHVIGFLVQSLDGVISVPEVLAHTDSL